MPETREERPKIQGLLLALSDSAAFGPIAEHIPEELMPLVNQPFIARILASLVNSEVKDITVVVCNRADLFSGFLGDGSRWGCRLKVVAVASEAQAYARLPGLAGPGLVLLGHCSTLPMFDGASLNARTQNGAVRFVDDDHSGLGWYLLTQSQVQEYLRDCGTRRELDRRIAGAGAQNVPAPGPLLCISSPAALLKATRVLLEDRRPDQLIPGASAEKGVHLARNVVIHPTARIIPPIAIDADCKIDRGAQVGPFVVIGEKTILGNHTILENAVIFPETYIGPHLELKDVCVDHNCLAYGDGSGAVPVPDPFLLSVNRGHEFNYTLRQVFRRISGTLGLIVLGPLTLLFFVLALVCGVRRPLRRIDAVRLPAAFDPQQWQTFRYFEFDADGSGVWARLVRFARARRLPTLWNVVSGDVSWVGLRPLTPRQLLALTADWRQIYRGGRVGLVRLAELDQHAAGEYSDDQVYSSEAFYVVTNSLRSDAAILWRAVVESGKRHERKAEVGD